MPGNAMAPDTMVRDMNASFRYPLYALGLVVLGMTLWGLADFHAFIHFWGIDTQQSDNYDFFSGPGSPMITVLMGSGVFFTVWTHLNCAGDRCPRVGRYPDSRGVKWCWEHHPDHGGQRPTAERLHRLHREHVDRLARHGTGPGAGTGTA